MRKLSRTTSRAVSSILVPTISTIELQTAQAGNLYLILRDRAIATPPLKNPMRESRSCGARAEVHICSCSNRHRVVRAVRCFILLCPSLHPATLPPLSITATQKQQEAVLFLLRFAVSACLRLQSTASASRIHGIECQSWSGVCEAGGKREGARGSEVCGISLLRQDCTARAGQLCSDGMPRGPAFQFGS